MNVRSTVRAAATVVSASTFVLLYFGLVDLARVAGIHDARAWLYPLAIDGMVAAGYASTLVLRGRHLAYAWGVVAVGSLMSLLGQWLHAEALSSWSFAGPVAAAPALSMSLVWHLLWLVSVREEEAVELAPVADIAPATEPATVAPAVRRPVRRPAKAATPAGHHEQAVALLSAARAAGRAMSGAEMAQHLGLSHRSGQRWLRRAEEALAS